jgi:hypothetical protein
LAVVLTLLLCIPATAQTELLNRVGEVFDDVAQGINKVGEKAEKLVGPGLGFGEGNAGGFAESREFSEKHPVAANASVSIANEFGEIRAGTWDNEVVQVSARISVRGETADMASAICKNITVQVTPSDNHIEVRTVLPDMQNIMGKPTIEVHYEIVLPRDASLTCRNNFGDTYVTGVGGSLGIDASFGAVDVRDITGAVNVRARGEFPLVAQGLRQGGVFELHSVNAVFRDVAGDLKVRDFWGSVEIRDLPAETNVDVDCESGPVSLYLTNDAKPSITATVMYGDVQSDVPLNRISQGDVTIARLENAESKQQIALRSSFREIAIKREGAMEVAPANPAIPTQPFKEVVSRAEAVLESGKVRVEGVTGDIRIVGTDATDVRATATKFVRVQSQSNVRAALQALNFQGAAAEGVLTLRTSVTDNMAALGCTSYRVDLTIECPRTVSVEIHGQEGHTAVSDLGVPVVVNQDAGTVSIERVKGEVKVTNQKGDVRVVSCAGPVEVTASFGTTTLLDVYGKMTATVVQGKTVIETPRAEIIARSTGGDIRILSLEGVAGNYDVRAEQGNISILIPAESDAYLAATVENGTVRSAIPLTGTIRKDVQEFVRNSTGAFRVTLQTKDGDIMIN